MAYSIFKGRIKNLLDRYHNFLKLHQLSHERDFIKRTTAFFRNRSVSYGGQSLKIRSAYIDRSPIVEFFHRTPWSNPARREVGDILLVSKFIREGQIIKNRATIVQSKFTRMQQRSWKAIDTAQFYLVYEWPDFKRVHPKPRKIYKLNPKCLTWGTYSLIGPNAVNYPIYLTSRRMFRAYPSIFSQKTFTFNLKNLLGWDTSPSFLMKVIFHFIGEDLLSNNSIKSFVNDLYGIVHLKPDPPGEYEWDFNEKEEQKGFGLIEFTLSSENEISESRNSH